MKSAWSDISAEHRETIEQIRETLSVNQKGGIKQTIQNAVTVLLNDPLFKGAIRYNLQTEKTDIVRDVGWSRSTPSLTDDDLSHILLYLEMFYDLNQEIKIRNALRVVGKENEYHPIREKLESLVWDGQERLRYVLHRYLGAEISDLNYEAMKIFMLGAIERVYHPGCKFEIMLCLVGDQGLGKSTFFRFLALKDEWFSDDMRKLDDDNVYRKMQGHWIIEMAEMLGTSSAKSVEEIKAFLSRQKETYKDPYDKYARDRPRQCVFVGTSNKQRFLPLDRTGNRRFYPIATNTDEAEVFILDDVAATRQYMEQLWAEVMVIYKSKDWSLKLPKEMEKKMDIRRLDFMAEDTATGSVQAWLDSCSEDFVCTKMIYNDCYHMLGDPDPRSTSEINSIMNHTVDGWVPGPQHRFSRYGQQRSWVRETVNREPECEQISLKLNPSDDGFEVLPDDTEVPFKD